MGVSFTCKADTYSKCATGSEELRFEIGLKSSSDKPRHVTFGTRSIQNTKSLRFDSMFTFLKNRDVAHPKMSDRGGTEGLSHIAT